LRGIRTPAGWPSNHLGRHSPITKFKVYSDEEALKQENRCTDPQIGQGPGNLLSPPAVGGTNDNGNE
jgi:hypothetical protein